MEWITGASSPKDREERYRLSVAEFYKHNFAHLVMLLGYKDIGEFHLKELRELNEISYGVPSRKLWLWSRGHFKTSIITEAHIIYLIINNPDIRVLVVSNTLDIAKTMLKNVKEHFVTNNDFRSVFTEFCPRANKDGKVEFGTTENFTIPNRTRQLKEHTVTCAGIGTNLTGLHFDHMKIDDLVTKDSVTNEEQIKQSKEYYSSLRQLYDNPLVPCEDVIGTTYHFNDLYQDILKNDSFEKSFIPVKNPDGSINFKERFSEQGLEDLLNDPQVGPYQFSSQYMLNPINPKDAKFKEEWIKYYDLLPENMAEYITVDPASTQKKKSDYTVIERWGIDYEGRHYLLEGIRDKLTSFQRIDRLFQFVRNAKNLKWVRYEVLGGRHGDLEVISERMRKDQIFFQIKETKSTSSSKQDRITQRLVGPYHSGAILWPKSLSYKSEYDGKVHNFVEEFRIELLQFPFTVHDDILDCQAQMFEEENILGMKPRIQKKKEITAGDWDRFYKNIDSLKNRPFMTGERVKEIMFAKKFKRLVRV